MVTVITVINNCRVCGLHHDDFPWGEDGNSPSFAICKCCGVEFGYEDITIESASKYRTKWLEGGAVWSSPKAQNHYFVGFVDSGRAYQVVARSVEASHPETT